MVVFKIILLIALVIALIFLPLFFVLRSQTGSSKSRRDTQRIISDPDLLRLIDREPDQLISPHLLSEKTDLTLNQARSRLNGLTMFGILNRSVSNNTRYYYSLKEPLPEDKNLRLSPDPFLTVEDLLNIFEAHHYRVFAQELIMATSLPLGVIKREMKHFQTEGIIQSMRGMAPQGVVSNRFYILQEPYRSNPESFRARSGQLDLELKEILLNENLIV